MTSSDTPFFSIVVPTYNRAQTITKCIQSVLSQSFGGFEILIVDDGSTDNTRELVEAIKDERIKYHLIENSGGPARPRNVGTRSARSEWICFLDSDDFWFPSKLEKVKAIIDKDTEADFIYHFNNIYKYPDYQKTGVTRSFQLESPVCKAIVMQDHRLDISNSSVVVRKKLLEEVGYITEKSEYIEDYPTWLKISKLTDGFRFIPEALGGYTVGNEKRHNYSITKYLALRDDVEHHIGDMGLSESERNRIENIFDYYLSRCYHLNGEFAKSRKMYLSLISPSSPVEVVLKAMLFYAIALLGLKR